MSEDKINENRIKDKIRNICQNCICLDKIVPIINEMLKEAYKEGLEQGKFDKKMENEELLHLVTNKVMLDYDYDSILKKQLEKERLQYIALQESKNMAENILNNFEKWLEEKIKIENLELEDNEFTDIYITSLEQILRKLQEIKENVSK